MPLTDRHLLRDNDDDVVKRSGQSLLIRLMKINAFVESQTAWPERLNTILTCSHACESYAFACLRAFSEELVCRAGNAYIQCKWRRCD